MKYAVLVLTAVLFMSYSASAKWLTYADWDYEGLMAAGEGYAYLAEFTMPPSFSTIAYMGTYLGTAYEWLKVKFIIYDGARNYIWSYTTSIKYGNEPCWCGCPVSIVCSAGKKFYVGTEFLKEKENNYHCVDLTPPHHIKYMWVRNPTGQWYHPEYNGKELDFMMAVEVTPTPAVEPTSLGRVKAIYR